MFDWLRNFWNEPPDEAFSASRREFVRNMGKATGGLILGDKLDLGMVQQLLQGRESRLQRLADVSEFGSFTNAMASMAQEYIEAAIDIEWIRKNEISSVPYGISFSHSTDEQLKKEAAKMLNAIRKPVTRAMADGIGLYQRLRDASPEEKATVIDALPYEKWAEIRWAREQKRRGNEPAAPGAPTLEDFIRSERETVIEMFNQPDRILAPFARKGQAITPENMADNALKKELPQVEEQFRAQRKADQEEYVRERAQEIQMHLARTIENHATQILRRDVLPGYIIRFDTREAESENRHAGRHSSSYDPEDPERLLPLAEEKIRTALHQTAFGDAIEIAGSRHMHGFIIVECRKEADLATREDFEAYMEARAANVAEFHKHALKR